MTNELLTISEILEKHGIDRYDEKITKTISHIGVKVKKLYIRETGKEPNKTKKNVNRGITTDETFVYSSDWHGKVLDVCKEHWKKHRVDICINS